MKKIGREKKTKKRRKRIIQKRTKRGRKCFKSIDDKKEGKAQKEEKEA